MAKNKNRKQPSQQRAAAQQGTEQAKSSAMEAEAKSAAAANPGDVARKHRERRFGHN